MLGVDVAILKKLNATLDVFTEKRTGILGAWTGPPAYTGLV